MKRSDDHVTLLPTLTHARIRVAQGDPRGAEQVLRGILAERPDDADAQELLGELRSHAERARIEEPHEEPPSPPVPGDPEALRARFREVGTRDAAVVRLSDYLERIGRRRQRERPR